MSYVEESVQCPYNAQHIILKSRLIKHLCKCRKQYGTSNFSICPFNATHRVLTPELQYHVKHCSDRKTLDSYLYVVGDKSEIRDVQPVNVEVPGSESWDDGPEVQSSYLDLKDNLILKRPILRLPVGKSKSERKQFFANEVFRHEKLKIGEVTDGSTEFLQTDNSLKHSEFSGTNLYHGIKNKSMPEDLKANERKNYNFPSPGYMTDGDDCDNSHPIVLKNIGRGKRLPASSKES